MITIRYQNFILKADSSDYDMSCHLFVVHVVFFIRMSQFMKGEVTVSISVTPVEAIPNLKPFRIKIILK